MKKPIMLFFEFFLFSVIIFSQDLGGGYKNAKWGMNTDQVKKVLSSNTVKFKKETNYKYNEKTLEFTIDNSKTLECTLFNNKLYYVEYKPNIDDPKDRDEIILLMLDELKNKYGTGKTTEKVTATYSPYSGWYDSPDYKDIEQTTIWEDDHSLILMEFVYHQEVKTKKRVYIDSYKTKVTYVSKLIYTQRND